MTHKPLLFLDVDGMVGVWDFDSPDDVMIVRDPEDGRRLCIVAKGTQSRVEWLAEVFEPVWATAWFDRANGFNRAWGINEWPVLRWGATKLESIPSFAQNKSWAFVDDEIGFELRGTPEFEQPKNALLYSVNSVNSKTGLTDEDTEFLVTWARDHT